MHPEPDSPQPGRIAQYENDDENVVVYDTENDDAWIESTVSESLSWNV
jgi:hypothetical protein